MEAVASPLANVPERIARLEERMGLVQTLLEEIRREQKELGAVIARASGGLRVLLLLGGLAGVAGALRGIAGLAAVWVPHAN